ncbi:MAG: PEPxxWA-CTERM sorting domain-containing protein [Rubrivivax sp.]|nr:PEPxxWA-CTERM sorting domain-containing protein [Rubrivivax sp.]
MHDKLSSRRAAAAAAAVVAVVAIGLGAAAPASASNALPFNATVFLSGGGASPFGRCAPDLTVDNPGMTDTHSSFGPFVFNMSECLRPPLPTTTYDGQFLFEFGNGTLAGTSYSVISATAVPGVFNLDGEYTVTGGTGAFQGATGLLVSRGQLDRRQFPPDATATLTLVGTVTMIPEPASWALLAAGLGLVAGAARRRARADVAA